MKPSFLRTWKVKQEESGLKLITFLKSKFSEKYSLKQLKKLIDHNCCSVNKRKERFSTYLLGEGDLVTFEEIVLQSPFKFNKDDILYEDNDLLIYNKPPNIASDSEKLLNELKKIANPLFLIHRLDLQTSGILMWAKSQKMLQAMIDLFKKKEIEKEYLAIIDGGVLKNHGVVENFLGEIKRYQGHVIWGEVKKGLHALTEWFLLKKNNQASLLKCYPKTGRTHQIRVHLAGLHHPILGDFEYGKKFKCLYHPQRILLHAHSIKFEHPFEKKELFIKSPVPQDFKEAMDTLFGEI